MGVARLLAKGWVMFCLFAGAHGFYLALARGDDPAAAAKAVAIAVFLFGAMGLLFVAGFGAAASGNTPLLARFRMRRLLPSFDGAVFAAFVIAVFAAQVFLVPEIGASLPAQGLHKAMYFVVPGESALVARLSDCGYNQPLIYSIALSLAISWLLAIIFIASAAARIGIAAGLLRLERLQRGSSFGPTLLAALYGIAAIVSFQLLFMGSAYPFLACRALTGIAGAALTGLAPLMLAYLIFAALVTLKASGPEAQ
jgi:hypothetical protein